MKSDAAGKAMTFGRDEADWDVLAAAGEEFLVERARLVRLTSYTELNTALERRTSIRGFHFELQAERAGMGHLLGLIVRERNRPVTSLMISALVVYIDGNDAGPGFYKLAQDLGELPPGALSTRVKEKFWIGQVKALYAYYGKRDGSQWGHLILSVPISKTNRGNRCYPQSDVRLCLECHHARRDQHG